MRTFPSPSRSTIRDASISRNGWPRFRGITPYYREPGIRRRGISAVGPLSHEKHRDCGAIGSSVALAATDADHPPEQPEIGRGAVNEKQVFGESALVVPDPDGEVAARRRAQLGEENCDPL